MQFQVPQFIEAEDKIVGPLSLRQFLYVAAASGLVFLLYLTVQTWLWLILSLFILSLGIALAFVQINGRPLSAVIFSATKFYWQPQNYVWQPENQTLPKTEATLRDVAGGGFSLEKIIRGISLKSAWRYVQTGSKEKAEAAERKQAPQSERYEVFRALRGERQAARRVDYR